MSTTPTPAPNISSSSHQPADVLYRSLATSIEKKCTGRHETEVELRRLDDASDPSTMHAELTCSLIQMPLHLHVNHVGGTVYDVSCTIEEGSSCQFSYSLPIQEGTSCLGDKIASFLLDELERELGRLLLCGSVSPAPQEAMT